jgi:hypothetical protein
MNLQQNITGAGDEARDSMSYSKKVEASTELMCKVGHNCASYPML